MKRPVWRRVRGRLAKQRLYRSLLPTLRQVARDSGYALGVHGSMRRDLDLIAVPWVRRAVTPTTLAVRLQQAVCGLHHRRRDIQWTDKPHGRKGCALWIGPGVLYLDLSVVPFAHGVKRRRR